MTTRPTGTAKGPLRVVIVDGCNSEMLECGHVIAKKHDLIGPSSADRRRCWKCRGGKSADVAPEELNLKRSIYEVELSHGHHQYKLSPLTP